MPTKQVTLVASWYPRGELERLKRYFAQLQTLYADMVIALSERTAETQEISTWLDENGIRYHLFDGWSGRHVCVQMGLETNASHLHYVDFDRLLRWVECHPDELQETIHRIPDQDLLIIGRTEFAWSTHPQSMIETESLFNTVFSHYFRRKMDFGAGARGLSQSAAAFVLKHSSHAEALTMDAAWSVLLKRAGFAWDYIEVDGLEWESADQYKARAATREEQRALAEKSDVSVDNWQLRTQVAQNIIQFGLEAMNQSLPITEE